ncbi:MAG: hypothetical protein J0L99_09370 [Chitinophagales bacterium]|nr:hypothetical protein [Chitinophagales bacterium]
MQKLLLFLLLTSQIVLAQSNQINIPRIEQMPNQPAPYNMRDWRTVALRYDSFVYDINKTGQYLPLVSIQPAGVNYPQKPAFSMHTYVGTNSPNGNEGINVLPSLVGATLCGIDKRNQFGQNWLDMSQDFYNKNNGLNLYLNSKGGGTGSDWWYDMMPNVYFYQLCDLYPPAPGSEASTQFVSVADRMLAAVQALGGSETPWQKGNFDYRAFNFQTMQPNPNGVHEPEAAGAYAWLLYNAYRQTGNEQYRKGAEWSLEFLNDWQANPSYELQLPYGTLCAARMNAEIGTRYDVEKMLNWSFNRGPLRGWGTIVGKWGSFDCSGLVGEANDNGNDYAFQLNGVQHAAALVPMVRYDKRFARAIGKWVLNLANATRLYYPGFLPANYQDANAWSNANDPERVVGYEALREKWQNLSPYSTGDALGGNWAATNLSLYSTGSIGYLGAMVEKTNVDKILKINVLKTDFYKDAAYPTYLFFNPYNSVQSIAFDAGQAPADLYDAISEEFLVESASGGVSISIPANGVLLVSVCPAGATRLYKNNQFLVGGVVVDYMQTKQSWQRAPRIQALAAAKNPVEIAQSTSLFAQVQPGDSGTLEFFWSAGGGTLNPNGNSAQWTAPATSGAVNLQLIVQDGNGLRDTALLNVQVVPEINLAPQIINVDKGLGYSVPGGTLSLSCNAIDPNNDPLSFEWNFSSGSFSGTGNSVEWTAPTGEGIYNLTIKVTDDEGLSTVYNSKLLVKNFQANNAQLIAFYKFSGNANDLTLNQLHGIPFGTSFVNDVFGGAQQALSFNGVNSRVSVNSQPVLNFQDGITVSAWFKASELPAKESFLISHGSWQNRWKISFTPEKHLRWTVNTLNAVSDLDTEFALQTDSFYHVTATYDGQLLALYLNGRLHSYRNLSGKIRTTSVAMLFGQILPGNTEYNYKGVLDEVKIYNHALIPESVRDLYQEASTGLWSPVAQNSFAFVVAPNPVQSTLRLQTPGRQVSGGLLRIYQSDGRLIWQGEWPSGETHEINVNSWSKGIYIAVLQDGNARGSALIHKQ